MMRFYEGIGKSRQRWIRREVASRRNFGAEEIMAMDCWWEILLKRKAWQEIAQDSEWADLALFSVVEATK